MSISFDKALGIHEKALGFRAQRAEVLANNIANADTPNYKARDFNFTDALKQAMGETNTRRLPDVSLNLTSARHIPAAAHTREPVDLLYRQPVQPSLDGNTVDMDLERVQFADNTQRYQADLTIISSRIKGIMSAMQQ